MNQILPFSIAYSSESPDRVTNLRAGKHFRFDVEAINHFCLFDMPSRVLDFLRIASAIYVVDRLVKRKPRRSSAGSLRTIDMRVEVFDDAFWNRNDVREVVANAVRFVSGDFWNIAYVKDQRQYFRTPQLLSDPDEGQEALICLFSGGLDSVAGLATRLAENANLPVFPITVWHQPRQRVLLHRQYRVFHNHFHSRISPLIVKVAMKWSSDLDKKRQENSQRCRSFLFTALGAIAAIVRGQNCVEMFESGIGAINLPLMAGMVGSKNTRSSHPEFLRLMSQLSSLVAESPINFRLPFFEKTKGQVVKRLAELNLQDLANSTPSCVGYPLRHSSAKQCGLCPACIFRRQAMIVAGIAEPNNSYKYDIFDIVQSGKISPERLKYLKAFLMQVAHLKDVEKFEHLPGAIGRHLLSTNVLKREESQKDVIDLLARHRDEWITVAADARSKGHPWANWLASPQLKEQGGSYVSA